MNHGKLIQDRSMVNTSWSFSGIAKLYIMNLLEFGTGFRHARENMSGLMRRSGCRRV